MAINRVTPSGWLQETGALSRVTPFGWLQETTSGAAPSGFKGAWATRQTRFIGASMYPRNAASPERIAIGPVVQISDGAVQTSGCTVRVLESGGTEGDGGGTTAYSTDGVVLYTPTQAETDQASFVLIAKKSGCIPAAVTIVTSASATAGYAGLDWAKVTAPTTTLNLSGTTIATTQKVDIETIKTQAVTAAAGVTFPTSVASPTNITAGTITTATNVTTVNGLAAGVITAASIATDAIGADEIAANAITKIQAGLATPTNITAGTITTVTNLTNAPTNGDLTATMKTSVTTAATAATPTAAAVTGAVGSVTAEVTANVTKISGDATAADNAELFFDGTGYAGGTAKLQVEIVKVAGEEISGSGTALDPWGPAS